MSSDGDIVAFQNSVNDNLRDTEVYFNDKNYVFITDSTSNSGSFSSGMVQFDLSTLNSQSQWLSLADAVIELPVKITARLTTALAGTTPTNTIANIQTAIIKSGWHQWIDSAQLIINGQTIQSAQTYENICASFRILSSWSQDTLRKHGTSAGFALDDMTSDAVNQTATTGLNNAVFSTVATSVRGFDGVNNQAILNNKGVNARNTMTNVDINPATATVQSTVLGSTSMKNAGRSHVGITAAGTNTANTVFYSANFMLTVRFRELFDISEFPLCKNLKGFAYFTVNSSVINLTGPTAINSSALTGVSVQATSGRTCPILINNTSTGLVFGQTPTSLTATPVVQITASVDGSSADQVNNAGALLTSGRLLVPFYKANPTIDSQLSKPNHFFTSLEKIVNPITVAAGASTNYTITVGVPNAKKLLLLPMWQNMAGSNLPNPELSCFDTVPASSGVYAGLNNLQVYLGNQAVFQYPITYDYEMFLNETSQLGLNGGSINESTSSLLSEQLWTQNHRYYYVDLSRRLKSEDGASRSVQVSFTNPSSTLGMKVIAIVWFEKQWICNTEQCLINSV
jgi:hypothetical protein